MCLFSFLKPVIVLSDLFQKHFSLHLSARCFIFEQSIIYNNFYSHSHETLALHNNRQVNEPNEANPIEKLFGFSYLHYEKREKMNEMEWNETERSKMGDN